MKIEGMTSWVPIEKFNTIGLFEVLIRITKFYKIFKRWKILLKTILQIFLLQLTHQVSVTGLLIKFRI